MDSETDNPISPTMRGERIRSLIGKITAAGVSKYQFLPLVCMIIAGLALSLIISEVPADVKKAFTGSSLSAPSAHAAGAASDTEDSYFIMTDDSEELELIKNITSEFSSLNETLVSSSKPKEEEKASPIPYALKNPVALSTADVKAREKQIKANEEAARQRTNAVWCRTVTAGNRNLYLPQYYYGAPALPKSEYGSYPVNSQGIPMSDMKMPDSLTFDEYGVPTNYLYCLEGKATAYYGGPGTATGQRVHQGCVAVDPRIIPYGTEMWIVSSDGRYIYGYSRAEDTGGFIYYSRGPLVDLYMDTYSSCCAWGLRYVKIYILPSSY